MSDSRYVWIVQRAWIRARVLRWFREAIRATCYRPTVEEREQSFRAPLENLADFQPLPSPVRAAASQALKRLDEGRWEPMHCLMHGDAWRGNLLWAPDSFGWGRFVLIDWAGALARGYGILDLISMAPSLRLKGARLRSEVETHCRILGCELADARCHLLAALGYIESHRGYFPSERFVGMATSFLQRLDSIGA